MLRCAMQILKTHCATVNAVPIAFVLLVIETCGGISAFPEKPLPLSSTEGLFHSLRAMAAS